ncbi:MAG: hypothetical protein GX539_12115 [Candidatus Cloacimonetes bacterium]|nr:hypothetical protein [Candidatus Cloacimonadota bacterium]
MSDPALVLTVDLVGHAARGRFVSEGIECPYHCNVPADEGDAGVVEGRYVPATEPVT